MRTLKDLRLLPTLDQENVAYSVGEIHHHLNGVRASIKEIQIDLFHLLRHLEELITDLSQEH